MSSLGTSLEDAGYWRSLAELAGSSASRERLRLEFEPGAGEAPDGPTRRRFFQLMGASMALAGAAGCNDINFLPLSVNVPGRLPGIPRYYATAIELGGVAQGVLATSYDGRPIKVEGNPDHPLSRGGSLPFTLASVLELYDPDRSRQPVRLTGGTGKLASWDQVAESARPIFNEQHKKKGAGFRILSEASSSDTLSELRERLLKDFPEARWFEYEPVSRDNERAGSVLAFGKPLRAQYSLAKADVIVCIDDDLLAGHPASIHLARDFADRRDPEDGAMNRLYAVEGVFSTTGGMADHRLPIKSSRIAAFVAALEAELGKPADSHGVSGGHVESKPGDREPKLLKAIAKDLSKSHGRSLVTVGPRQPAEVHAAAHRINASLGNVGQTVSYTAEPQPDRLSHLQAIAALASELSAGKVECLVIIGGNPAYDAPVDLNFRDLLGKAKTSIHLSTYLNETSQLCGWHLPRAHYLESWGDARSFDGTYTVVQPLIEPISNAQSGIEGAKSAIEILSLILAEESLTPQELVRRTFKRLAGESDSEPRWRETLDRGFLAGSAFAVVQATPAKTPLSRGATPASDDLELVFVPDSKVYDGRFANNGWLQELPDFMTKLTWDNAALVSPATAAKLGVDDDTLIRLNFKGGRTQTIAALIQPGQADDCIAVALGYGRTSAGIVGGSVEDKVKPVGSDVYKLRSSSAPNFESGLTIVPTGISFKLATTQDHHAIDSVGLREREHRLGELVREATVDEYKKDPGFAKELEPVDPRQLFESPAMSTEHKWGLAIDLSRCIGCNACVVACQSENNIPVVGKEQVINGREMHWIRIDRYFKGDVADPEVVHQPVACVHCEAAPCEQVCPFAATVHDSEGLNAMVYNRCAGTRYCSNNCPFKVRRFNFFNYHKDLDKPKNDIAKLVYNPEVTIRSRGVMEKCSYCTHRIQAVKIVAKNENREIGLEEITPACAQACPAKAISFGDLKRSESTVARDHANKRSYALLAELNIRPRTAYLARIRNPHPDLVEAEDAHERHA